MNLTLEDSGEEKDRDAVRNDVPVLRRAAMDYLARREHSAYELQQKLSRKFPDVEAQVLQQVLDRLQHQSLQSDDRFAEVYVRYRKSRGFGFLHIRADLLSRRVDEGLIHAHLQADDPDWLDIGNKLIAKKLPPAESLLFGSKRHKKLVRFLQSRGFGALEVRSMLARRLSGS